MTNDGADKNDLSSLLSFSSFMSLPRLSASPFLSWWLRRLSLAIRHYFSKRAD